MVDWLFLPHNCGPVCLAPCLVPPQETGGETGSETGGKTGGETGGEKGRETGSKTSTPGETFTTCYFIFVLIILHTKSPKLLFAKEQQLMCHY